MKKYVCKSFTSWSEKNSEKGCETINEWIEDTLNDVAKDGYQFESMAFAISAESNGGYTTIVTLVLSIQQ